MSIKRTAVTSSTIAEIGYDAATNILEVSFKSGGVYQYTGVSPKEHAALMAAESKGRHIHTHIKPHHTAIPVPGHTDKGGGQ